MPVLLAVIAGNDFSLSSGRFAALIAENCFAFCILGLEQIGRFVVTGAAPTDVSAELRHFDLIQRIPGLVVHCRDKATILAHADAFEIIPEVLRKHKRGWVAFVKVAQKGRKEATLVFWRLTTFRNAIKAIPWLFKLVRPFRQRGI